MSTLVLPNATLRQWLTLAGFLTILLVTACAYWPGLSGPFLLDDYTRLAELDQEGGVTDLRSLAAYLDSAWTGKTGRLLALLSFLIDHNDWPAPAWDFKYTNLMLHLLNGCLLFALLLRLLRHADLSERERLGLALFCTFGWLAHPLLVSTTLYPVQRMAILSTTAVLAGLLGYLVAREGLQRRPRPALVWMTLSLGFGGCIGMLAKENAALILPLALVLEGTALPSPRGPCRGFRNWRWAMLGLPSLALLGFLISKGIGGLDGWDTRDFNSVERLLTQGRMLCQYLYYWFIPQGTTPGVLNSGVVHSSGLVTPWTTLPAVLAIIALIAACVWYRRRAPWLAAGFGFFLVGHALESTTIALELYFEHRNYLAGLLLWLPVGMGLLRLPLRGRAIVALFALIPVVLVGSTYFRATTWGDAKLLTLTWTEENPRSERAYGSAALALQRADRYVEALHVLDRGVEHLPNSVPILLHSASMHCRLHEPSRPLLDRLRQAARDYHLPGNHYRLLKQFVETASGSHCKRLTVAYTHSILEALLANLRRDDRSARRIEGRRTEIYHLMGNLRIASGKPCEAYRYYLRAAGGSLSPGGIAKQAAIMTRYGFHWEALHLLDLTNESSYRDDRLFQLFFDSSTSRIHRLRARIQKVADPQSNASRCSPALPYEPFPTGSYPN